MQLCRTERARRWAELVQRRFDWACDLRRDPVRRALLWAAGPVTVLSTSVVALASVASNARTFTDPRGDACCTEDITRVVVTNDDAGTVAFEITGLLETETAAEASDRFIPIETEHRRFEIGSNSDSPGYSRFRLAADGKRVRLAAIHVSDEGSLLRFPVDRHLLGDADRFSFHAEYWAVTPFGANLEAAPDRGTWTFPIKIDLRRIRSVLTLGQTRGRSRTFVARLALHVGRSRQLLAGGTIQCAARAGGRDLALLEKRFVHRRVVCRWRLPRNSPSGCRCPVASRCARRRHRAR
jgi:hypothetical protein